MNGYKTVTDLTEDQAYELKQRTQTDMDTGDLTDIPAEWVDSNGDLTDEGMMAMYGNTLFTDDDFLCTANGVGETSTTMLSR